MPPPVRISVVTACLNSEQTIRETIESVRQQDYPHFEHVVMDGGSKDATLKILAEYPHLTVASQKDEGHYHAMNLGVGFSSKMNDQADRVRKRKLGNFAYLKHFVKLLFGLEMQKYVIQADGFTYRGRATEIFIANYGVAGLHILEDRLDIHPDDGKVDILIMRARTVIDLPVMLWQMVVRKDKRTPKYRQFTAEKSVTISTKPPNPVQTDGELVGMTPVNVTILPRAIRVIAPN